MNALERVMSFTWRLRLVSLVFILLLTPEGVNSRSGLRCYSVTTVLLVYHVGFCGSAVLWHCSYCIKLLAADFHGLQKLVVIGIEIERNIYLSSCRDTVISLSVMKGSLVFFLISKVELSVWRQNVSFIHFSYSNHFIAR